MTGTAFTLATDSCCDVPSSLAEELGLVVLEFPFTIDGEERFDDLGASMPSSEFFARMRAGSHPTTAQVPLTEYLACFSAAAEEGRPLLFLSFSSGLSGTYDAAVVARDTVLAEYPDADVRVVDTLAAAAHQGLLVVEAARRWRGGDSIDEVERFVREASPRINGYFTLDSLESLRRGGRLSDVAAKAASVLDVKPVLRVDGRGGLVMDRPVRGRRKSLRALVDLFDTRATDARAATVVVTHADAPEDAQSVATALRERREIGELLMLEVGPVIGTHTGPGMVGVIFHGPERDA